MQLFLYGVRFSRSYTQELTLSLPLSLSLSPSLSLSLSLSLFSIRNKMMTVAERPLQNEMGKKYMFLKTRNLLKRRFPAKDKSKLHSN